MGKTFTPSEATRSCAARGFFTRLVPLHEWHAALHLTDVCATRFIRMKGHREPSALTHRMAHVIRLVNCSIGH
jgi:hypothetical protein